MKMRLFPYYSTKGSFDTKVVRLRLLKACYAILLATLLYFTLYYHNDIVQLELSSMDYGTDSIMKEYSMRYKSLPIFVVNFNSLTPLKETVSVLHSSGYTNIHILDNNSTYPPLKEYYQKIRDNKAAEVHLLKQNWGHQALWKAPLDLFPKGFKDDYFVCTDPDLELKKLPEDWLLDFIRIHQSIERRRILPLFFSNRKPFLKIGSALRIDNLLSNNTNKTKFKQKVIDAESFAWENTKGTYVKEGTENQLYEADIDTTLALYPPGYPTKFSYTGLRVAGSFEVEHKPWYYDDEHFTAEYKYYLAHKSNLVGYYSGIQNGKPYDLKTGQPVELEAN
jgi:hypothetical protein